MTEFILVRHAQADYSNCEKELENAIFAPLSKLGVEQAKRIGYENALKDAEKIISSPYNRAMQTAAYISATWDESINVICEFDLHEWLPDVQNLTPNTNEKVSNNFKQAIADYNDNVNRVDTVYESLFDTRKRALNVLKRYTKYSKVVVVTHGGVIYSLTKKRLGYAEYTKFEL